MAYHFYEVYIYSNLPAFTCLYLHLPEFTYIPYECERNDERS